jgi:hypothetical protein
MTTWRVMGRSGPLGRGFVDFDAAADLAAVSGGSIVADPECPDCGASWPNVDLGERCPVCGLSEEDVEAAADFWAALDPGPL